MIEKIKFPFFFFFFWGGLVRIWKIVIMRGIKMW